MAPRVVLPESRLRLYRRRRRLWFMGSGIALLILIVGGSIALLWVAPWRITQIQVTGTQTLPASAITQRVQTDITGAYGFIIPKNNVLVYPKQYILHNLLQSFPTIAQASVGLQNFHTLQVQVTERTPAGLYCGSEVASNTSCYLLDRNGLVYASAAQYSGTVYVVYFGSLATGPLPQQYLSPTQFQSLMALAQAVSGVVKNSVTQVYVDPLQEVHMTLSSGFTLLFMLDQDPGSILNRLTLALTADPFTTHPLTAIEYLDLRFGDKLYYKLK